MTVTVASEFFWWGVIDPILGGQPILWYTQNGNTMQSYNHYADIPAFLEDGYRELSTNTAHMLGLPT